ncbi:MAG: GNAT family N-acetyltransferase [Kiritimatiellae bacterium]|nr:GNAT family N-acetyltransferase [Kiritimatiellia bacterium]
MNQDRLAKTVRDLCEGIGPRPPGSWAELEAAEYMARAFEKAGLRARLEPFASGSHLAVSSRLARPRGRKPFASLPAQFSAAGDVSGPLAWLGTVSRPLVSGKAVRGKIGLLVPDGDHRARIARLTALEKHGLKGLVVVGPHIDAIDTKPVRYPEVRRMPVVCVSFRTGSALRRMEGTTLRLQVRHRARPRQQSQNVVATLPGTGPNWLAVSAHLDTAPGTPGAVDNAGGTAVVLETARRLARARLPATVLFVASGSEEYGRTDGVGAGAQAFYAAREAELPHCLGHIEIDGVGGVFGVACDVAVGGSRRFRQTVLSAAGPRGCTYRGAAGVGCDHGAAEQRGVPYAWFREECAPCAFYHTPEDTPAHLDIGRLARYVPILVRVVRGLAAAEPPYRFIRAGERLVRPARHADMPAIAEITKLAYGPVTVHRMREEFFKARLGGKPWQAHKAASVLGFVAKHIYRTIVCEVRGQVVAFATYDLDEDNGIAGIGDNAVRPDWQGQGIGTLLQQEVRRRMREDGYRRFRVGTLAIDAAAQRIYEKMGYVRVAESYHYLMKR